MRTPPGEHEVPPRGVVLIGTHVGEPVEITVESEGVSRHRRFVFGDVWLIPPNTPFVSAHREATDASYVLVDPSVMVETAARLDIDRGEFDLGMNVGVRDETIQYVAHSLLREATCPDMGQELYVEALVNQLAIHLLRDHAEDGALVRSALAAEQPVSDARLRPALELIHDNLGGNLSLREMAAVAELSPHHFSRSFKRATGTSPHQYVLRHRVELARSLLTRTSLTISEVARQVGFYDQSHLSVHFKRVFGITPGSLRDSTGIDAEPPQERPQP